jgi:hypothetical protein
VERSLRLHLLPSAVCVQPLRRSGTLRRRRHRAFADCEGIFGMATHADLLNDMSLLRAALIRRYKWFVHETPNVHIDNIWKEGLLQIVMHQCRRKLIASAPLPCPLLEVGAARGAKTIAQCGYCVRSKQGPIQFFGKQPPTK